MGKKGKSSDHNHRMWRVSQQKLASLALSSIIDLETRIDRYMNMNIYTYKGIVTVRYRQLPQLLRQCQTLLCLRALLSSSKSSSLIRNRKRLPITLLPRGSVRIVYSTTICPCPEQQRP